MDAVTAGTRTQISPYAVFDRGSWRALAAGSTLPLDEAGLRALASLGDRIDLDEVATVYLPLARLLDLHVEGGHITAAGVETNVEVALRYIEAWLRGQGAVAIHNLMEDAATAEISRSQVWQWVRHGAHLSDGRAVTQQLVESIIAEEMDEKNLKGGTFDLAARLFNQLMTGSDFPEFLTLVAYEHLD